MHTCELANSVFDGLITTLLSALRMLIGVLSSARAKWRKSRSGFKFGTSIGRFLSNPAASVAVKGLKETRSK